MFDIQELRDRAAADLRNYAESRARDVARGAETPELAGVLVQKYGYGMAQALRMVAYLAGVPDPGLISEVDRHVGAIDANWRANMTRRYSARPAALQFN